jgi:hypothetical protein
LTREAAARLAEQVRLCRTRRCQLVLLALNKEGAVAPVGGSKGLTGEAATRLAEQVRQGLCKQCLMLPE